MTSRSCGHGSKASIRDRKISLRVWRRSLKIHYRQRWVNGSWHEYLCWWLLAQIISHQELYRRFLSWFTQRSLRSNAGCIGASGRTNNHYSWWSSYSVPCPSYDGEKIMESCKFIPVLVCAILKYRLDFEYHPRSSWLLFICAFSCPCMWVCKNENTYLVLKISLLRIFIFLSDWNIWILFFGQSSPS